MANVNVYEQLDEAVQAIVTHLSDAKGGRSRAKGDARTAPLIRVASELRDLPRENFRARLKADLGRASMAAVAEPVSTIPQAVAAYLTDILQANDAALLASALGDIARARGMTEIAKSAGITREALYRALRPDSSPRFDTVSRVCTALGIRLVAQAVHD